MPQILPKKLPEGTSAPVLNKIKFDESTFEVFFKENFTGLCAYCQYKFGFDLDLAKEATHSGFIKLWENRHSLSPDLSAKAYLYKIVTNTCCDFLRHEKVKQKHENHVIFNSSFSYNRADFDRAEFNELRSNVDNAISSLPEQMRKIFELSRYEGLKYVEIAAALAISVKTVETQMGRALVKLRRTLAEYLSLYVVLLLLVS